MTPAAWGFAGVTGLRRGLRAAGATLAAAFAVAAFTPAPNRLHARLAPEPTAATADAIVALGAAVDGSGRLSDHSLRRTVEAVVQARRGSAPLLVFLGAEIDGRSEAEERAHLARELGVKPEAVLTLAGLTTRHEASVVAARLAGRGARRILLVTGATHMPRARRTFEAAGLSVVPSPVDEAGGGSRRPWDRLGLARALAQELLARGLYRVYGWR